MRRLLFPLLLILVSAACAPLAPPAAPPPTPVSLKPANLLTPRPATPTPLTIPVTPVARKVATPTATPEPTIKGTRMTATEPLQGVLVDDRLHSPIIGEDFAYR